MGTPFRVPGLSKAGRFRFPHSGSAPGLRVLHIRPLNARMEDIEWACEAVGGLNISGRKRPAEDCHAGAKRAAPDSCSAARCCSICMRDIVYVSGSAPIVRAEPCGHDFHPRCLLPRFVKRQTCPTCHASMATVTRVARAPLPYPLRILSRLVRGRGVTFALRDASGEIRVLGPFANMNTVITGARQTSTLDFCNSMAGEHAVVWGDGTVEVFGARLAAGELGYDVENRSFFSAGCVRFGVDGGEFSTMESIID